MKTYLLSFLVLYALPTFGQDADGLYQQHCINFQGGVHKACEWHHLGQHFQSLEVYETVISAQRPTYSISTSRL